MLLALLIIGGLNLGILLVLAWVILREVEEAPEYHVGFRMESTEQEDEDADS